MSEPKNSHFVSKVYLNNFSFDENGNLYSLSIKSPYPKIKVKERNISQICYEEDIYKIKTDKVLKDIFSTDPNYIEKNLFSYETKFLNSIKSKIENCDNLEIEDARNFIKAITSIKYRNTSVKEKIFDQDFLMNSKNNNFNLFKDHLRTNGIPIDENPNFIRFFELAEEAVSHQLKNENVVSDIYNQTIIEIETGTNSINNYVVDELLKCHITILCTSKLMPFITSDNPGFVLHPNGKIENTILTNAEAFVFPLTPTRLIIINLKDLDSSSSTIKKITYTDTNEDEIKKIYIASINVAKEKIFSNNFDVLEGLKLKYHHNFILKK